MFCSNCGREVSDQAVVCVGCGADVKKQRITDSGSAGWWWLGFLIPLAGFLVWLTCNDTQPKRAKKAGIGALVGVIVSAVLVVLVYVLWIVLIVFLAQGTYL